MGLLLKITQKLVQNVAARVADRARWLDLVMLPVYQLQQLPVHFWVQFKNCDFLCHSDFLCHLIDHCPQIEWFVPYGHLKRPSCGIDIIGGWLAAMWGRAFSMMMLHLWNYLPSEITLAPPLHMCVGNWKCFFLFLFFGIGLTPLLGSEFLLFPWLDHGFCLKIFLFCNNVLSFIVVFQIDIVRHPECLCLHGEWQIINILSR